MTMDNDCGRDDDDKLPGTQAEAHSVLALEQSALYAAQLAIARWINSSADAALRTKPPAPTSPRTAWYAQAQENFQEWLGRGGFAQYDTPRVEGAAPNPDEAAEADSAALPMATKLRRPTMYQIGARRRIGRRITA